MGQAHREAGPRNIFLFLFDKDRLDISCVAGGDLSSSDSGDLAISDDKGPEFRFRFCREGELFSLLPLYHSGCGISTQSKTSFGFNRDPLASSDDGERESCCRSGDFGTGRAISELRGGESTSVGRSVKSLRFPESSTSIDERDAAMRGCSTLEGEEGAEGGARGEISCCAPLVAPVGLSNSCNRPNLGEGDVGSTTGERKSGMFDALEL